MLDPRHCAGCGSSSWNACQMLRTIQTANCRWHPSDSDAIHERLLGAEQALLWMLDKKSYLEGWLEDLDKRRASVDAAVQSPNSLGSQAGAQGGNENGK